MNSNSINNNALHVVYVVCVIVYCCACAEYLDLGFFLHRLRFAFVLCEIQA